MEQVVRKWAVCCLMLFAFAGHAMAQDAPYVIKKDGHYLSHVKIGSNWVLKDDTIFHPDSCLWYSGTEFNSSGTNHNYYFFDGANYRFLSAPLQASGSLSLSSSLPYTYLLRNQDEIYYFYDWDADSYGRGVARGKRYYQLTTQDTCEACGHDWGDGQCWEVYWVVYDEDEVGGPQWKLSDSSHYHIVPNACRYRGVEVIEHDKQIVAGTTSGGLSTVLADFDMVYSSNPVTTHPLSATATAYSYQYIPPYITYTFEGGTHNFFDNSDHGTTVPAQVQNPSGNVPVSYVWTVTGEGATYLSFASGSSVQSDTLTTSNATLYYRVENTTGDKLATLTLTVIYTDGAKQSTSATVTVKTNCQNPGQDGAPVVTNLGVTVQWYPTAQSYTVSWKKTSETSWNSVDVGNVTSYTFSGLEYETEYQYKVQASCDSNSPTFYTFTTKPEPGLVVFGAIYGGGRMANVTGKTEVVVVNCDSIGAVYGGNDIAGEVEDGAGSTIQLGVNTNDVNHYDADFATTSATVRIGSVYGGGNGYYAYDGATFTPASDSYNQYTVPVNGCVKAMTQMNQVGDTVWTNDTEHTVLLEFPSIVKTAIAVTNDFVKVDSVFGGAKNAFLTLDNAEQNGSSITVDGGTLFAVFGGNNIGGTVKAAQHHIQVNQTTTLLEDSIVSTATTGYGCDFGIRYLFGGGNKVKGAATDIHICGGQCDTVFGGGNLATVDSAFLYVNCAAPAATQTQNSTFTFGKIYSNAIQAYYPAANTHNHVDSIVIKNDYDWDGIGGIYNVHTLFGGNNRAPMYGVPHITLTSGSIGTAYGGGNAGDMKASLQDSIYTFINYTHNKYVSFKYGTKIEVASPDVLVDYIYGGCQVSSVDYSTFVDIKDGYIGSVYGGCNVSGDVGSTRTSPNASGPSGTDYQAVMGGTFVRATGGTVYEDFFGGSNGFYHCNDGTKYKAGVDYGDPEQLYIGKLVPTHNETHLFIGKDDQHPDGVTIKGDAYTGGNLACVGFTNFTIPYVDGARLPYPEFVGLSSLHMDGGRVEGSVYGGGRMASVYGSNEVKVNGGYIGGALYGGNDRAGQVAQITNRVWPLYDDYTVASDSVTALNDVHTYVGVTGNPHINTVYGGGNGDYIYEGEGADMEYCLSNDQPIQSNTFVDVHLENNGRINTVYGGGNGVTVTGAITVFLNVNEPTPGIAHVGTIFGGNNKGSLDILSDIILLHGRVDTVYGGCNKGAMLGSKTPVGTTLQNVGSFVRLRSQYPGREGTTIVPDAVVGSVVYGGCRMNEVTNNSIVLVEGGTHGRTLSSGDYLGASIFGGSDISGDVRGTTTSTSQVIVTGGSVGDVFGGGNGAYYYSGNKVYYDEELTQLIDTVKTGTIQPPYSRNSRVDMSGGTASNLFAGGYKGPSGITTLQMDGGDVVNSIYGGGMKAGVVKSYTIPGSGSSTNITSLGTSTVTVDGGTVGVGVYGGSNIEGTIEGNINVNIHASLGTANDSLDKGIYGGGFGPATRTKGNVTVTVDKKDNTSSAPVLYADVYGGSAFGQVNMTENGTEDLTNVIFNDGQLYGILYGGGEGGQTAGESDSTLVNGNVRVDINGGTLYSGIYGGCNAKGNVVGNISVNVMGGTVGATTATADIFGGGYGQRTIASGNVTVTVDKEGDVAPVIYGSVYGGSGFGDVNTNSSNATTVNILDGFFRKATDGNGGDIYGGGLGDKAVEGDNTHHDYPAHVNGMVYVNIGSGEKDGDGCAANITGNATIEGSVYGCNNVNGTPLDSVFVNIYKTAHGDSPQTNHYPIDYPTNYDEWSIEALAANAAYQAYAISAVYGGGNRAAYLPPLNGNGKPKCATVHVWDCRQNTIREVYGGGNAADVGSTGVGGIPANTRVIIDGGRIHQNFGGGNGYSAIGNHDDPDGDDYNPGANIYGTASSYIYAGLIDEVYGGANQYGSIDVIDLHVLSTDCCDDAAYGKVFGCANEAPINHSIVTTIGCGVGEIGELYGGSNLADIGNPGSTNANVTLNVYGGDYESVFGGSKGQVAGNRHANIYGDVTLNIYGGKIVKAFGGSDQLGNVFGTITVNVDTVYNPNCDDPYQLDTVFGAGNVTYYNPYHVDDEGHPIALNGGGQPITNPDGTGGYIINGPIVNIINGTVRKAVFGGGKGATAITTANPQVNIGVVDNTEHSARLARVGFNGNDGDVYGGGFEGKVLGGPVVNVRKDDHEGSNTIIYHDVFGGGDMANVDSTEVNVYDGTIISGVYGGCNVQGAVTKDIVVNIYGGVLGNETEDLTEGIFGGGYGGPDAATNNPGTTTGGNVTVNIGGTGYAPIIYGTVYGGSALGSVNENRNDTIGVHLISGTVYGNVFGGGLGVVDNPETDENEGVMAHVNGDIHVIGDGANVNGWVFGANDQNGDPAGTVVVTVNDGIIGNVVGGGNVANYTAPGSQLDYPYVTVNGGTVTNKVVGGGNDANITGNPHVLVTGGTVGTDSDATTGIGKGIYGGCNSTGIVTGSTYVTLTGGTVGVNADNTANIHGGGYGKDTEVHGDVFVVFGLDNNVHSIYPLLYGELYGGSALGKVNIDGGSNTTLVELVNGTIHGEAYGGGLGDAADEIAAMVYGDVQVNVGRATDMYNIDTYTGVADLVDCDVYGGNNLYGSPKKIVYVDVYKTHHTPDNIYENYTGSYAVDEVFGGGNRANYDPDPSVANAKAYVYIHLCENTIRRVFGGGNAAYVPGVDLTIDGGRFDQVYGGGNGELGPDHAANVGTGGIHILLGGGRIRLLVNGSNDFGSVDGTIISETMEEPYCDETVVEDYFLGNNHTDLFEDIIATIYCGEGNGIEMRFVNLYCGSNQAKQYGNINVTIEGGVFENVYGGSKGDLASLATQEDPDHVDFASDIKIIPDDEQFLLLHPELAGRVGDGGNITLDIIGGTIGDLYGGCNINGNVEGKITLTIHELGNDCGLFVGNIYGASNQTNYTPIRTDIVNHIVSSPEIKIIKGVIGGKAYNLPINNPNNLPFKEYEGNVYGGGKFGSVTSNPKVIVGDGMDSPVTIEGNVFGGGHEGNINGYPEVIVVPNTHKLTYSDPDPSMGVIGVLNCIGDTVRSGSQLGEGLDVKLVAIADIYGHKFNGWTVTGEGASVARPTSTSTIFTMGTSDATLVAVFGDTIKQNFKYSFVPAGSGCVVRVYDGMGNTVNSDVDISRGAVLNIVAIPAPNGFRFDRWEVIGGNGTNGNGTITNLRAANTTFTVGSVDTEIKAIFISVPSNEFTYANEPSGSGSSTVTDGQGHTVNSGDPIGVGTVLNIVATPATGTGYEFGKWLVTGTGASVGRPTSASTTFTMGSSSATLTATFVKKHNFTYTWQPSDGGSVRVTDASGSIVNSNTNIAEGAALHIEATPAPGYTFTGWTFTGTGASVGSTTSSSTTFNMGTSDATLQATFELDSGSGTEPDPQP